MKPVEVYKVTGYYYLILLLIYLILSRQVSDENVVYQRIPLFNYGI